MATLMGELIAELRLGLGLTQDQFGAKYDISGPAVFKFEKGFVNPSLGLWLRMAADLKIPEKTAVLIWLKARLPEKYQSVIPIKNPAQSQEPPEILRPAPRAIDYAKYKDRKTMRRVAINDRALPKALREFLNDDEVWVIYKPSGEEIIFLRDTFGRLGLGTPEAWRDALRAMRAFKPAK